MTPRVCWVGAVVFAALAVASACLAAEPAHAPGQGAIGGDIGASSFRFDRVLSNDWFSDYSAGAQNRFAFSGRFRYVVNNWLRWQIGPGLTWTAYGRRVPAPFKDLNFPQDSDKGSYLALMLPATAEAQLYTKCGWWVYHLGVGPGVYRVWVENHRKVLKDPATFNLHRGLYPGGSAELGVERFLKSITTTSLEATLTGHLALAQRDEQFVSGLNSNLMALELRVGANYYFGLGEKKKDKVTLPKR